LSKAHQTNYLLQSINLQRRQASTVWCNRLVLSCCCRL